MAAAILAVGRHHEGESPRIWARLCARACAYACAPPLSPLRCADRDHASQPPQKPQSILVRLVSAAGTGYCYYTRRSITLPHKIVLRKFDPVVRRHVIFEEQKMPRYK